MRWMESGKALACACAVVATVMAASSAEAASQCSSVSATGAKPYSLGPLTVNLDAGDVVTLAFNGPPPITNTLTVGSMVSTFTNNGSTSVTIPATGSYTITATGPGTPPGGTATLSCVAAASTGSNPSPDQQRASNAQASIANATRTLQSYQEWVTKGVLGSFGMTRGGDTASTNADPAQRQARARVETLTRREREIGEEVATATDDAARGDLERELKTVRRDLAFARVTADVAQTARYPVAAPPPGTQTASAPSFSLDACDFASCDSADPLARRWNAWAEGRVVGVTDSLAQTATLGFAGAGGVDYKFLPWLAVGLSVGVESNETRLGTAGARIGAIGVTALPYFGMRLHENVYAEGFVGLTRLSYNTTPAVAVAGSFDAWRVFVGGGLSGIWHDGNWRFQPSILGAYGSETQNGYTDSTGTVVPGQTLSFGRIAAGPEIGYTLKDESRGWTFEPFVNLKANVDFASNPVFAVGGTAIAVRPGTQASGQAGGGIAMQLDHGFYLRVQAAYESIGVSGLDIWSGRLRAGVSF